MHLYGIVSSDKQAPWLKSLEIWAPRKYRVWTGEGDGKTYENEAKLGLNFFLVGSSQRVFVGLSAAEGDMMIALKICCELCRLALCYARSW